MHKSKIEKIREQNQKIKTTKKCGLVQTARPNKIVRAIFENMTRTD